MEAVARARGLLVLERARGFVLLLVLKRRLRTILGTGWKQWVEWGNTQAFKNKSHQAGIVVLNEVVERRKLNVKTCWQLWVISSLRAAAAVHQGETNVTVARDLRLGQLATAVRIVVPSLGGKSASYIRYSSSLYKLAQIRRWGLVRAWNRWTLRIRRLLARDALHDTGSFRMRRIIERWQRKRMAKAFRTWMETMRSQDFLTQQEEVAAVNSRQQERYVMQHLERTVKQLLQRRMAMAWRAWTVSLQQRRQGEKALSTVSRILQRWRSALIGASFWRWFRRSRESSEQSSIEAAAAQAMVRVLSAIMRRDMVAAWRAWRAHMCQQQQAINSTKSGMRGMSRVIRRWERRRLARGFASWNAQWRQQRLEEARSSLAWQAQAMRDEAHLRQVDETCRRFLLHALTTAWRAWAHAVDDHRRACTGLQHMRRLLLRWNRRRLAVGWNQWAELVWQRRRHAEEGARAEKQIQALRQRRLASITQRMRRRAEARALRKWIDMWRQRSAEGEGLSRLQRIVQQWERRKLAAGWSGWNAELRASRQQRGATTRLNRLVRRWQHQKLHTRFDLWERRVGDERAAEAEAAAQRAQQSAGLQLLSSISARLRHGAIARGWRTWRNDMLDGRHVDAMLLAEKRITHDADARAQRTALRGFSAYAGRQQGRAVAYAWRAWRDSVARERLHGAEIALLALQRIMSAVDGVVSACQPHGFGAKGKLQAAFLS